MSSNDLPPDLLKGRELTDDQMYLDYNRVIAPINISQTNPLSPIWMPEISEDIVAESLVAVNPA